VKYLSVCSGIEAATVAWHGLGWEPVAFSEIDPFPSALLAHHYPNVPNLGDLTKYREWPEEMLAEVDLLVGGSPCQAFSVAGLRKSLDDERGNLSIIYVHLFRHINEIRRKHGRSPAIAVWENVPGVLSTKDNAFGCFVSGLLGVDDTIETQDGKWPKAGFLCSEAVRVGYRVLDAQYFGVAQRRRRVFLVAVPCELVSSLGERACPSEILSLRESIHGNPFQGHGAREVCASANQSVAVTVVDPEELEGLGAGQPALAYGFNWQNGGGYGTANEGLGITVQAIAPLSKSQVPAVATATVSTRTQWAPCASCGNDWCNLHGCHTHDAQCDCRPLSDRDDDPSALPLLVAAPARRVTPTEAERLQGFPDGYTSALYRKKPAADGPRYRALGNSMAVPCMWWLGFRIQQATR
jgi:DNA (cytosine-5)-methyltransferase 1